MSSSRTKQGESYVRLSHERPSVIISHSGRQLTASSRIGWCCR